MLVAPLIAPPAPHGVGAAPPAPHRVHHPLHSPVVGLVPLGDHAVRDPPGVLVVNTGLGVGQAGVGVGPPGAQLLEGATRGDLAGGRVLRLGGRVMYDDTNDEDEITMMMLTPSLPGPTAWQDPERSLWLSHPAIRLLKLGLLGLPDGSSGERSGVFSIHSPHTGDMFVRDRLREEDPPDVKATQQMMSMLMRLTELMVTRMNLSDLVSVPAVRNDEFLLEDVCNISAGSLGHHRA